MGVDYYTCEYCGEAFPDCGRYTSCDNCWTRWCSDECAEADGIKYEYDEEGDAVDDSSTCKYCRKEDAKDFDLLPYALARLKMTREDLVKDFYKENSK